MAVLVRETLSVGSFNFQPLPSSSQRERDCEHMVRIVPLADDMMISGYRRLQIGQSRRIVLFAKIRLDCDRSQCVGGLVFGIQYPVILYPCHSAAIR